MYSRFAASVNSGGATGASLAVPGTVARVAVTDCVFWAMSFEGTRACRRSQAGECRDDSAVLAVIPRECVTLTLMLTRRTFVGLGLALVARRTLAFGEAARFAFAQVRHGGRWDPRPDGLGRLAWEIAKRTSIETSPLVKPIALSDPDLFHYPFAVISSDQAFPALGDAEVAALRRYLS